jgi:hypothetical protein
MRRAAPGTELPLWSVTEPLTLPTATACAKSADEDRKRAQGAAMRDEAENNMDFPL